MGKRIFVNCTEEFPKSISRDRAKGYTNLNILAGDFDLVEVKSNEESLDIVTVEGEKTIDMPIMLLCKDFGLVEPVKNALSEISVIFLDKGYMLVTLFKGALFAVINGEKMLLNINMDTPMKNVEAYWVDSDKIMSLSKDWGEEKSLYPYDYEFFFDVAGRKDFMRIKLSSETIDISRGYIAQYIATKKEQEEKRQIKKSATNIMNDFLNRKNVAFEFDDDDDEDDEEEWYEDDDEYYSEDD